MNAMKKIHILGALLLGALLTISCKQEAVPAPETDKTVTIRAVLDPETRTFYENEKYFSWVEGDNVSLMVVNDDGMQRIAFGKAVACAEIMCARGGAKVIAFGDREEILGPAGFDAFIF